MGFVSNPKIIPLFLLVIHLFLPAALAGWRFEKDAIIWDTIELFDSRSSDDILAEELNRRSRIRTVVIGKHGAENMSPMSFVELIQSPEFKPYANADRYFLNVCEGGRCARSLFNEIAQRRAKEGNMAPFEIVTSRNKILNLIKMRTIENRKIVKEIKLGLEDPKNRTPVPKNREDGFELFRINPRISGAEVFGDVASYHQISVNRMNHLLFNGSGVFHCAGILFSVSIYAAPKLP